MNALEREIKSLVLKTLLAQRGQPMTNDGLKLVIKTVFAHVAFTESDLDGHIKDLEKAGFICGTNDELSGLIWALTSKGELRAKQL
ncbi:MAG TPA: hypothetical protein VHY30_01495 [Verrucomicrobiae bacterium]|jgi:hypothetical protein|nr:hypothetical protein [Verrucomicrobiae bacterium]